MSKTFGLLVVLFSFNALALGIHKPPADISKFTGRYEQLGCSMDSTGQSTIPHHINIIANAEGQARIRLETHALILTTRDFAIQDQKKTDCFADSGYKAKCKTKFENDVLNVKASWRCEGHIFGWCVGLFLAERPKNYSFQLNADHSVLSYVEDKAKCEYRKIQGAPQFE